MIDDLRVLSLADAGELSLNRRLVDPAALLERYGLAQRPCPQAGRRFKDRLIYPRGYALNAADRKLVDSITAVRDSLSIR